MDEMNLAETVVDDFTSRGLAEYVDETTMRSLDGNTEVALEARAGENGESEATLVFVDGSLVQDIPFTDDKYQDRLITVLTGALNI